MIYTMELIVDRAEVGLGGSSLRLVYIYSLYGAFLAPTCIVLDRYSWDYIRLAYAMDTRRYIYLLFPPAAAAAARALFIVSICLIYVFFMTYLVSPNWG